MACRKNNWPLDRSVMYTAVSRYVKADEVEERPEEVLILIEHKVENVALGDTVKSLFYVSKNDRCVSSIEHYPLSENFKRHLNLTRIFK